MPPHNNHTIVLPIWLIYKTEKARSKSAPFSSSKIETLLSIQKTNTDAENQIAKPINIEVGDSI
jgi:hypothetical protein